jgi:CMP-N-acetylneuraminic acid synthetase
MKVVAFIFARGGSKGLPDKNIRVLAGKPLVQYSIETAFATPSISKVFVSTDNKKIAQIALAAGAIIIERPNELATDNSPEWLSWRHAIEWVTDKYGKFDYFVSLPATSPLRSVGDVESAISKCIKKEADICISVTSANRSPYFNMVKIDSEGNVDLVIPSEFKVSRRQDAPEVFDVTTVVYVSTPHFILNNRCVFSGKVTSINVPKERAVDIDDILDFKLAEIIINES